MLLLAVRKVMLDSKTVLYNSSRSKATFDRFVVGNLCESLRLCSIHFLLLTSWLQNPVQAWKVPGGDSRVLTTQVSFNRKNSYLLASSQVNQVYIWDTRKVGAFSLPSVGKTLDCFSHLKSYLSMSVCWRLPSRGIGPYGAISVHHVCVWPLLPQIFGERISFVLSLAVNPRNVFLVDGSPCVPMQGQKPIDTIPVSLPTEHVTSLDWSSER